MHPPGPSPERAHDGIVCSGALALSLSRRSCWSPGIKSPLRDRSLLGALAVTSSPKHVFSSPGALGALAPKLCPPLDRLGAGALASKPHPSPDRRGLGPSWGPPGLSSAPHGPPWGPLGALLGRIGALLGHLEALRDVLERSWRCLGPLLGRLGWPLKPSWGLLGRGPNLDPGGRARPAPARERKKRFRNLAEIIHGTARGSVERRFTSPFALGSRGVKSF